MKSVLPRGVLNVSDGENIDPGDEAEISLPTGHFLTHYLAKRHEMFGGIPEDKEMNQVVFGRPDEESGRSVPSTENQRSTVCLPS